MCCSAMKYYRKIQISIWGIILSRKCFNFRSGWVPVNCARISRDSSVFLPRQYFLLKSRQFTSAFTSALPNAEATREGCTEPVWKVCKLREGYFFVLQECADKNIFCSATFFADPRGDHFLRMLIGCFPGHLCK